VRYSANISKLFPSATLGLHAISLTIKAAPRLSPDCHYCTLCDNALSHYGCAVFASVFVFCVRLLHAIVLRVESASELSSGKDIVFMTEFARNASHVNAIVYDLHTGIFCAIQMSATRFITLVILWRKVEINEVLFCIIL